MEGEGPEKFGETLKDFRRYMKSLPGALRFFGFTVETLIGYKQGHETAKVAQMSTKMLCKTIFTLMFLQLLPINEMLSAKASMSEHRKKFKKNKMWRAAA